LAPKTQCFAKRYSHGLAGADLAAERTAARLRLCVLVLIGLVLVSLGSLAGVFSEWIATIFTLNFGVSVAAVVLARPAVFKSWVPWVVATLDVPDLVACLPEWRSLPCEWP
jgi:hypothetical protein